MNGALSGLVAVTGSCAIIENWAAYLIGAIAGVIYLGGSVALIKMKLDDAVDAIPVHLFNGTWGLLAVGLFASPGRQLDAYGTDEHTGWFYSIGKGSMDGTLLLNQLLGLLFILGWVTTTMLPFYLWLNYMGWFRADSLEELVGLDLAYMGGNRKKNHSSAGDEISVADEAKTAEDAFEKRQESRKSAKQRESNRSSGLKSVASKSVNVVEEDVEDEAPDDVSAISR
jgi:ammonia channel protein AmtB